MNFVLKMQERTVVGEAAARHRATTGNVNGAHLKHHHFQ